MLSSPGTAPSDVSVGLDVRSSVSLLVVFFLRVPQGRLVVVASVSDAVAVAGGRDSGRSLEVDPESPVTAGPACDEDQPSLDAVAVGCASSCGCC